MDEERRKQLIRQRAAAKASLTRLQKYIDSGERKVNQLQIRYDELPVIASKFEVAQSELETFDEQNHEADRAQFEEQYFDVKEKFMELLYPTHANNSPGSSTSSRSSSSTQLTHNNSSYVKLPSIELPSFDGSVSTWLHFRDTFDSLIIQNTTLSNVQKFHYLISSLKEEAKALIGNLPITNENFTVAWELVTHRYNNVKLIAMTHVKQLLQLPTSKRNDASSMRHLINHVSSNLNAIQALQLETSTHDLIMNHLLLSVLDLDTHKEWELQTAALPDIPSTSEVIKFLETRCKALELLQANQLPSTSTSQRSSETKVSQSHKCHMTTQGQCPLCKGPHRLYQCDKFINKLPTQRLQCVKQLRLCFNCLQLFNKTHVCSNYACRTCNKPHHTLLHTAMQIQSADRQGSTNDHNASSTAKQTVTPVTNNSTNEVQTYCSFKN